MRFHTISSLFFLAGALGNPLHAQQSSTPSNLPKVPAGFQPPPWSSSIPTIPFQPPPWSLESVGVYLCPGKDWQGECQHMYSVRGACSMCFSSLGLLLIDIRLVDVSGEPFYGTVASVGPDPGAQECIVFRSVYFPLARMLNATLTMMHNTEVLSAMGEARRS
jgi:hypothetical protein